MSLTSNVDLIDASPDAWGLSWHWIDPEVPADLHYFLSFVDSFGNVIRSLDSRQAIRYGPAAGAYRYGNANIDPTLFGAEPVGIGLVYLPVRIDLNGATFHPIVDPFIGGGYGTGRNHVIAVQTGPFARVDGTRSCLNLRTAPGLDAAKIACLADGVLLRHDSVAVTNQGIEWLAVTTPDGTQGWAATEFLEY
jgi:hypothetical protein